MVTKGYLFVANATSFHLFNFNFLNLDHFSVMSFIYSYIIFILIQLIFITDISTLPLGPCSSRVIFSSSSFAIAIHYDSVFWSFFLLCDLVASDSEKNLKNWQAGFKLQTSWLTCGLATSWPRRTPHSTYLTNNAEWRSRNWFQYFRSVCSKQIFM